MKIESVFLATLLVIVFIATITIFAELYKPAKDWLANNFWHHWLGKGIISIGLFIVISLFGPKIEIKKQEKFLIPVLAISTMAIIAFFVSHALKFF
ncbi:MAG TPA: hypothetical protein VI912_04595 [Candidatus Bilamarchaeaceae archaeon]|nr:hypothetical protein [Candidatus Bilamarchaeaceae archaeon]